jgi:hypothetical protein
MQFLLVALLVPVSLRKRTDDFVTVSADQYMAMVETFLQNELNLYQINSLWFQQDEETAHSAQISVEIIRKMFPGKRISHFGDINWSGHSPDLSAPDYFFRDYIRSEVYETHPASINDFERAKSGVHSRNP